MNNPLAEVGHGLEVAAKDVAKGAAYPFVHTVQFVEVIGTIVHDEPAVKTQLVALIQEGASIDVDVLATIASKGLDVPADLKVLLDVQAFFTNFRNNFLPVVEAAYKDLESDTKS